MAIECQENYKEIGLQGLQKLFCVQRAIFVKLRKGNLLDGDNGLVIGF